MLRPREWNPSIIEPMRMEVLSHLGGAMIVNYMWMDRGGRITGYLGSGPLHWCDATGKMK